MKYADILEEEIKNKVTQDFFQKFDCTKILGKIDFAVKAKRPANAVDFVDEYFLWAEAKQKSTDVLVMLTQLVLTIGKERTFDEMMPPPFLGCYDNEKIAFVPYAGIQGIFQENDFNWKVAPSDQKTREFKQVYAQIKKIISPTPTLPKGEGVSPLSEGLGEAFVFDFEKDEKELKRFIRDNFVINKGIHPLAVKTRITKNNFIFIYNRWLETVKPTIQVDDWEEEKKTGIIDCDFYLADLLSAENKTLKEKLSVLLKTDLYELNVEVPNISRTLFMRIGFSDNQKAHKQFWAKYERPPLEEYWDFIVDHRHLLVPQDVRERKGSFYTPGIWVELSQKYLADVFGEDWQDEYYVWDCAAGTGNLLAGLTNKYNIWASTLDKADVDVMKDRIQNGANLLESHVFQFDFLNDDFSKLPKGLQDIINDPKRRKKLVIYINPPYAEAASSTTPTGTGQNKQNVATVHKTSEYYKPMIGKAINEVFAQFLVRIYHLIPHAKIATFGTLKYVNSQNFIKFREYFLAEYKNGFVCRANTFDNVRGKFPIGFLIWDLAKKKKITSVKVDVYEADNELKQCWLTGDKVFHSNDKEKYIVDWMRNYFDKKEEKIGYLRFQGTDFQTSSNAFITSSPTENDIRESKITNITMKNLIEMCIYISVRHCIEATWLNDRDQFLYPNDGYQTDVEFQNNCLVFTIFHNQNRIQSKHGVNHWIPFLETEINTRDTYDSHSLIRFMSGKMIQNGYSHLFEQQEDKLCVKREFSPEAKNVLDAGRELWKYYHAAIASRYGGSREGAENASLYDIREYFQGRNEKGAMNNKSDDETYNGLIGNLRSAMKTLAKKIEPKVYEYGFLKK